MEWWLLLVIILVGTYGLFLIGIPLAFGFLLVNLVGFMVFAGPQSLSMVVTGSFAQLNNFNLVPVPLFILLGEILFRSGLVKLTLDALDKWLGRVRGRLSLLAIASGVVLGATSGSSIATTAVLGSLLVPEMLRRGYSRSMAIGPVLGSGGLDTLIPPSGLAVLLGVIGKISIGKLLIAGIVPGLVLAVLSAAYIIGFTTLRPQSAPTYDIEKVSWRTRLGSLHVLLAIAAIIFFVTGVIYLGVATPSEAAAVGAVGALVVAALYGRLSLSMLRQVILHTGVITSTLLLLVAGAAVFGQVLTFSGSTEKLVRLAAGAELSPLAIVLMMQAVVFVMGMFMEAVSIMMITMPVFMPIIGVLGLDPVWFGVIMLVNIEIATITPPFGMVLFTMKTVCPPGVSYRDVCMAALPFVLLSLLTMALVIAFPPLALALTSTMK